MEILVLCLLALLIARHVKRKSKVIYIAHCFLFVIYFIFSFFTINLPMVNFVMEFIFGKDLFAEICALTEIPFEWAYSAGALFAAVELIYGFIVAFFATKFVVKKIRGLKDGLFQRVNEKANRDKFTEKNTIPQRKIFLTYCRLLN